MKKLFFFSVLFTVLWICHTSNVNAQGVGINPSGAPPNNSAGLDVDFTDKGTLITRMSTAQRDAISSPATGLMIFNTDCNIFNFNAGTPSAPNWITLNSANALTAGVSISVSPSGTVCTGTSVTFTATPASGITSVTYQWKVNGNPVGTNSSTYASSSLNNGDVVTCVLSSTANCVTGSPATSNVVTMSVNSVPASPTANAAIGVSCSGFIANWSTSAVATSYYLDVATDAGFSNFVTGYNNLSVGNVLTVSVSGLSTANTYYYHVRAGNSCGTSGNSGAVSITTTAVPATPGSISGPASVCPNATGQVYTIAAVPGATSYNWTVPSGAAITANTGTSITVTFGANPAGNITVSATNCGASAPGTLAITQYAVCSPMTLTASGSGATGTIQNFTVPAGITSLTIDAYGAQGGNSNTPQPGGKGARMKGTFTVTPGHVLNILVGQQPLPLSYSWRGGGGGTFVYNSNTSTLLIAAGGGAGANGSTPGQDALIGTSGGNGTGGSVGGSGGSGGTGTNGSPGGGGFSGNGGTTTCSSNSGFGKSFLNGGAGGVTNPGSYVETFGGYGGGGQAEPYCTGGPGAGGGYSGGGGCNSQNFGAVAGGGGSFNGGTNQTNTAGAQTGNGQVIFTW